MKSSFIDKFVENPKKLLLIDGIGALLSAFLLGVILTRFESVFGMPRRVLYFLAFLPCLFAVYDFICYFRIKGDLKPFLKFIAYANLIYCVISIGFLVLHSSVLTSLGWVYFLLELVVVGFIVWVELRVCE